MASEEQRIREAYLKAIDKHGMEYGDRVSAEACWSYICHEQDDLQIVRLIAEVGQERGWGAAKCMAVYAACNLQGVHEGLAIIEDLLVRGMSPGLVVLLGSSGGPMDLMNKIVEEAQGGN